MIAEYAEGLNNHAPDSNDCSSARDSLKEEASLVQDWWFLEVSWPL